MRSDGTPPRDRPASSKSERSQKVFGSGSNPSDVKKRSPYFTVLAPPILRSLQDLRRAGPDVRRRPARPGHRRSSSSAPRCFREDASASGPRRAPRPPYFSLQPAPGVCVERQIQRPQLIPEAIDLRWRRRPPACRIGNATSHRCRQADLPRSLVRELDEARVIVPHRCADAVPPFPHLTQARRVPALRENLRHRLDIETAFG